MAEKAIWFDSAERKGDNAENFFHQDEYTSDSILPPNCKFSLEIFIERQIGSEISN